MLTKMKDLREFNTEELMGKQKALKKDLFDLSFQRRVATVEKPARFKQIRREIAQILTILKERELSDAKDSKKRK